MTRAGRVMNPDGPDCEGALRLGRWGLGAAMTQTDACAAINGRWWHDGACGRDRGLIVAGGRGRALGEEGGWVVAIAL